MKNKENDLSSLINSECTIYISDPWEFGTINGCGPWVVKVIDSLILEDREHLVIFSKTKFSYKDLSFNFLSFTNRFVGSELIRLLNFEDISINIKLLKIDSYSQNDVKEYIKNDRSGLGCIGNIQLKK